MSLKIVKSTEEIRVDRLIVGIYAGPGMGKSTIGATARNTLILDFDRGLHRAMKRGDAIQPASWAEVADISASDVADYETIVVDTVGRLLDYMTADLIANNAKLGGGGGQLSLQGWGALKAAFAAWAKNVLTWQKDIVLLSHMDEKQKGDNEFVERLDIQGSSKNEVHKLCDAMMRIFIGEKGKRFISFDPAFTHFGKNPGGVETQIFPDPTVKPDFLADLIAQTKNAMNERHGASVAEAGRMEELRGDWEAKTQSDGIGFLNSQIEAMANASPKEKQLLLDVAKGAGFEFDRKGKKFIARNNPPLLRKRQMRLSDALSFSVTDLDSWRYFQESDLSVEDFLSRVNRLEPQHPAAALGEDFHAAIEKAQNARQPVDIISGARGNYDLSSVSVALPAADAQEMSIKKTYALGRRKITLRGRIDAISGNVALDWKTTSRPIDVEKYADALQWRCYLDMADLPTFEYHAFKFEPKALYKLTAGDLIKVVDYQHVRLESYAAMADDIRAELGAMIAFLEEAGWDPSQRRMAKLLT